MYILEKEVDTLAKHLEKITKSFVLEQELLDLTSTTEN